MTEQEKKEYLDKLTAKTKKYCRIDYDDDEDIIQIMSEAVVEKLTELIPGIDPDVLTTRQPLLVMAYVKDQYDNKDVYIGTEKKLSPAFSSMLLSEMYKGGST